MIAVAPSAHPTASSADLRPRHRATAAAQTAAAAVGIGVTAIVVADGTPGWRITRTAIALALTGLFAAALASDRRWLATSVALVVGAFTLPIGIAIGGRHLAENGFTWLAASGLVVLAGALVLTTIGTVWWVSPAGRFVAGGRILIVVATCFTLLWTLGQAVAATNAPDTRLDGTTPADVGLAYADVAFATPDHVTLSGWYIASRNGAAVALLHGAGSTRTDVLAHAAVLARHGFGVLLFDARGHGLSQGRAMDFGWFGDLDIAGATAFLDSRPEVDATRIGAVGLSMGGEQAVGATATNTVLAAVVAEGATARTASDKQWLSDEFGLRGGMAEQIDRLTFWFTDVLTDAGPPLSLHDAAMRSSTPILLIAASDVADEPRAARFIESGAPATVDVWVAPETGHTGGLRTIPAQWEQRVIAFLTRELLGS